MTQPCGRRYVCAARDDSEGFEALLRLPHVEDLDLAVRVASRVVQPPCGFALLGRIEPTHRFVVLRQRESVRLEMNRDSRGFSIGSRGVRCRRHHPAGATLGASGTVLGLPARGPRALATRLTSHAFSSRGCPLCARASPDAILRGDLAGALAQLAPRQRVARSPSRSSDGGQLSSSTFNAVISFVTASGASLPGTSSLHASAISPGAFKDTAAFSAYGRRASSKV